MIDKKYIKPIPNYIAKRIRNKDKRCAYYGNARFYAYFTKMKGELVKITVACKNHEKQWFCKQVAVHGVHSENCLMRDMEYNLMGFSIGWYDLGLSNRRKRYEDGKWYSAQAKYYNPFAEVINKKYALKFDAFKYSAVDKYPYHDIFKNLRIYEQYPQAEYFVKIGLQHLATNKTLLKKAAKDKNFRKWLIRNARQLRNEYGNLPYFSGKVVLASYKENASLFEQLTLDRQLRDLQNEYRYTSTVSKVIPRNEAVTLIRYMQKQGTNISSYADYIDACNYLGLDMTLPKNKFPHDFKRWHDIRIDEYHTAKALKDAEERKELYAKFAKIAEKYLGLQRDKHDSFIAVIAHSPQDFIREESLIFFIRNKQSPDVPFVTVEYSLS
ncbi:MAG: hypothetical protein HFE46_04515 [Clostridia bacterium]|nr:hypothetical protein [Clostridia bacterium]